LLTGNEHGRTEGGTAEAAEIRAFRRLARLMLSDPQTGEPLSGRVEMKKFEAIAGSAIWIAVSLLMAAAALEPVEVRAQALETAAAAPTCAEGSAELVMGCQSIHL
jgi:hypothetical protein